jgi:hypothetical protein
MILIVRILFGVSASIVFFFAGLYLGRWVNNHSMDPHTHGPVYLAYYMNTALLASFFTLWCVKIGVV